MNSRRTTGAVELVLDAKATLGESPLWHARRRKLYWVDILGQQLHEWDPTTGRDRCFAVGQFIGCVVPRKKGGLLLALHHGLARFDFRTKQPVILCDPDRRRSGNRFNDGKCDPAGRFWAGTMSATEKPNQGSLFCLDPDLSVRRAVSRVSISNGLAWSREADTMYFIDSAEQVVWAFDYDLATARIRNRRTVIRIPKRDGVPDGMTRDAEGMLWVAHWGGSQVTRWDPRRGRLLQTLRLPVSLVTSCAFGGARLDELFITSARVSLSPSQLERQPLAGGLFRVQPGVQGVAPDEFAG